MGMAGWNADWIDRLERECLRDGAWYAEVLAEALEQDLFPDLSPDERALMAQWPDLRRAFDYLRSSEEAIQRRGHPWLAALADEVPVGKHPRAVPDPLEPPSDPETLPALACVLAAGAHWGQNSTERAPYWLHPLRVAARLLEGIGVEACADPLTIAAALLHDCFEDGPLAIRVAAAKALPPSLLREVRLLTQWDHGGGFDMKRYADRLMKDGTAWRVKQADQLDKLHLAWLLAPEGREASLRKRKQVWATRFAKSAPKAAEASRVYIKAAECYGGEPLRWGDPVGE
ncbi:MAG TPA: HD domain-containing protein [bacterium]|nr:HD domain-containing protein [bacterium]